MSIRERTREILLRRLDPYECDRIHTLAVILRQELDCSKSEAMCAARAGLRELTDEGLAIETSAGFIRAPIQKSTHRKGPAVRGDDLASQCIKVDATACAGFIAANTTNIKDEGVVIAAMGDEEAVPAAWMVFKRLEEVEAAIESLRGAASNAWPDHPKVGCDS